ncbi:MAG: D-alanine aminotransferase [uncultured Gemmatimonadaceae bacterium]|uniref:D-alanine aminotransferase n=2 Tax=uncultured Gemmatimonadaceae bacterium TaxID=246130 RepID=A0A6J4M6L7_9BACT|nr:MAG: D-alanine aminotransferase [uncultured Gemmatimonadaceae bacterium]
MLVYLNGEYLPRDRAMVPVDDRGFLFGDGVYEVSRALDGRVVDHDRHARRLARNLAELAIAPAGLDEGALREIAERVLLGSALAAGHATVYLQVTRGSAPRTHHYPDPRRVPPTVYVSASPFAPLDAARDAGVRVITLPDLRWGRCDVKSINLLPNVMAKQAAVAAGAHEALFVRDDVITEGAATNVFAVVDGVVRTHPLSTAVLPGITREIAIELAHALGLPVQEDALTLDELPAADELFLTSTTNDVMPVVAVDGRTVGDGAPGPVTRRLADAFAARGVVAALAAR